MGLSALELGLGGKPVGAVTEKTCTDESALAAEGAGVYIKRSRFPYFIQPERQTDEECPRSRASAWMDAASLRGQPAGSH